MVVEPYTAKVVVPKAVRGVVVPIVKLKLTAGVVVAEVEMNSDGAA